MKEARPLTSKNPAFDVRPAEPSEYPTLVNIFNQVFKKDKDARTLEWKYLKNPHGKSFVWVAADKEGKIIGSLAFVPRKLSIDGREYPTFIAADGMVFPEWQPPYVVPG